MAIGKIKELRVMAPASEKTVAIELNGKVYFPLQDHRFNICALQDRGGKIAQWCRYLAFGTKTTYGDFSINNPWGFSNRREVAGLVQFTHRFYRPTLKRWLTTDPLSFEEDLNLYAYVKNNPHVFMDPDGRFSIALPILIKFGIDGVVVISTLKTFAIAACAAIASYLVYDVVDKKLDERAAKEAEEEQKAEEEKKKKKTAQEEAKRHDPDQQAVNDLAKERKKTGVTNTEADTLLEWADEYDFPARDDRGKDHWEGGEHIHIGLKHIPVKQ